MKADLHNHTIYSDGILKPLELAEYGAKKGIDLIAITDHDSVTAFSEDLKKTVIPIIKGVELSTYYNGENIHLVGYFINNESPKEIEELLQYFERKRKDRVYEIIKKLKKYYDIELTYDDIKKYADGAIGRVHVAKAIEEKYQVPFKETFDKYIGNDQLAYVPTENFNFKDAIDVLHKNNALAILAHPMYIIKNDVEELIKLGVDGIEAHYSKHTREQEEIYLKLAKKYKLLVTGGSDFHKYPETEDDIDLGKATVSGKELEELLNKLNFKIKE